MYDHCFQSNHTENVGFVSERTLCLGDIENIPVTRTNEAPSYLFMCDCQWVRNHSEPLTDLSEPMSQGPSQIVCLCASRSSSSGASPQLHAGTHRYHQPTPPYVLGRVWVRLAYSSVLKRYTHHSWVLSSDCKLPNKKIKGKINISTSCSINVATV